MEGEGKTRGRGEGQRGRQSRISFYPKVFLHFWKESPSLVHKCSHMVARKARLITGLPEVGGSSGRASVVISSFSRSSAKGAGGISFGGKYGEPMSFQEQSHSSLPFDPFL